MLTKPRPKGRLQKNQPPRETKEKYSAKGKKTAGKTTKAKQGKSFSRP